MRMLMLGGTVFLGRHVAAEALRRGHEVTLFHRGRHGNDLFPEAEHLIGDRSSDLTALEGRTWDAAVDTSGYEPADVAASSALLTAAGVEHLSFVSTCNVYPDWPGEPVSEDSPVWTEGDDYGPNKAACERAAEAALPGRVAALRAGLLCGPHDNVFRLPWWVARLARGGDVLAPGDPERTVQLVDVRDLAVWFLDLAEHRTPGVFNATAQIGQATMREVLEAAVAATGSDARLTWVPDDALAAAGVEPWTEVPLWLPEADAPGTWRVDAARAQAAGLRCPPGAGTGGGGWGGARGGLTPRARGRPACAAARWPRRWPTCGRGCRRAGPRRRARTGSPRTPRAGSRPSASARSSPPLAPRDEAARGRARPPRPARAGPALRPPARLLSTRLRPARYSHSIVPGGLLVMSSTTRLTSRSSLIIREAICSSRSYGSRAQSAVIASSLVTARITMTLPYVRSSPWTPTVRMSGSTQNDCHSSRYRPALRISSCRM